MTETENIYVKHDWEVLGPFSAEQVQSLTDKGSLSLTDEACTMGFDEKWKPLRDIALNARFAVPANYAPSQTLARSTDANSMRAVGRALDNLDKIHLQQRRLGSPPVQDIENKTAPKARAMAGTRTKSIWRLIVGCLRPLLSKTLNQKHYLLRGIILVIFLLVGLWLWVAALTHASVFLVWVAVFWICTAIGLAAPRFRDAGHSPWLALLVFVPTINVLTLIVLLFLRSKKPEVHDGPAPTPERPRRTAGLPPENANRATGALAFLLCAMAFCTIAILFFRPWEQRQASKQETYNPSKPSADLVPPDNTVRTKQQSTPPPQIDFSDLIPDQGQPLTPTEIFRRARPSVVLLTMQDARGQPISLGSGFFVDKDLVATNFHVIDGAAAGYAKVIGQTAKLNIKGTIAADALHDLALLQLDASSTPRLPVAAKLSANIGDPVYAIGNPQGLEGTFSQGIVSSVRSIGSDRILQITAPISPGSSGGPVLDQSGNVVGVSFASIEKGQNLNFAIPSDYLAALQNSKTEVRPLTMIPRAKPRMTLLDRIGNKQPMAGVVGENLTYDGVSTQTGQFSFSLQNKLRDNVTGVYGIVIFYDVRGEPIDVYPINYRSMIPAGTAKRIAGVVDRSVERLNSPPDRPFPYLAEPPRPPKGKLEFRILDFNVE